MGRRGSGGVVVLLLAVAAAGCLGTGPDVGGGDPPATTVADPADWAEQALPHGPDHDHSDPAHHRGRSTVNFEVLGWDPLVTDHDGRTSGDYFCGDSDRSGGRRLAVVHGWLNDVAMVVVDITDPHRPETVGELVLRNVNVYDVDVGPELDYVVLGTSVYDTGPDVDGSGMDGSGVDGPETDGSDVETVGTALAGARTGPPPAALWRDACTGRVVPLDLPAGDAPYVAGALLVDVRDPARPRIVDYHPLPPMGGHSVRVQDLGGDRIVLATVWDYVKANTYYAFLRIADGPLGPRLELASTYRMAPDGPPGTDPLRDLGAHDGYLQVHPVTGQRLAYLAYGSEGLVILDIDDLAAPRPVGRWNGWDRVGPGGAQVGHFTHEVHPAARARDGRHTTFVGEECVSPPPDAPTCYVAALDTTDPSNVEAVGFWTLPRMVPWDRSLQFSPHYLALQGGTLFVTTVHGGLWAVDVSTPEALAGMPSIGVLLPDRVSPRPPTGDRSVLGNAVAASYPLDNTPAVGDVLAEDDGTLTVFDATSGIYRVRFDPERPAPPQRGWSLGGGG